jgi:hypothetical protein
MTYSPLMMGSVSTAPSGTLATNNTGSTINKATPVGVNKTTGLADLIDVSDEISARSITGLSFADVLNGGSLQLITSGKIENVTTGSYGDVIYVSKTGGLTNVAPEVGVGSFVSKDWIIVVGVIAKNLINPLYKDLYVNINVQGQLE